MIDLSRWVGLPYQPPHGCWLLVRQVYRELFGIELDAYTVRSVREINAAIASHLPEWVAVDDERPGDLILIRGAPRHIAVVAGGGRMLHVMNEGDTSRIESYRSPRWRPSIEGFYRHAGI